MTATAEAPTQKDVLTLSAAALELELRKMREGEIREQMRMIEEGLKNDELSLVAREAAGVWHELAYYVFTDRDTREVAAKWDQLSRTWNRAANGKPEDLARRENVLMIRAAYIAGGRYFVTGLHEAAHAVIAHSFGAHIEHITVLCSDLGPACVTLTEQDMAYEARIMYRVASREALLLADIPVGRSCYSDLTQAHEIAKDALGSDRKAAAKVKELSGRVRDMLTTDKYRRQLLTVATALDRRISLSGDEFRRLLSRPN